VVSTDKISPPDLRYLFAPRSIAIIGATEKAGKRGFEVIENLRRVGFPGDIYPVNPRYEQVAGLRCYANVRDIPAPVEAAAIAVAAEGAVAAMRECALKGVRAAAVVAAGFAESGTAGARLQEELVRCAHESGMLLCGPNCLGVWSVASHTAYWERSPRLDHPSHVAVILQSGALIASLADPAAERGLVFAALATVGNQAVLTAGDYLAYLIEDPLIRAIALVIEDIRRPATFLQALDRAAELGKPIVVLKLGCTEGGRQAALAHTASLAGSHAVVAAALRQHGAILVNDLDQLLEMMILMEAGRLPQGDRMVAVTVSGAGCGLLADLAADIGLSLAPLSEQSNAALTALLPAQTVGNPLDVTRAGDEPGLYQRCVAALAADPMVDVLAIAQNTPWGRTPEATAFYIDHATAAVTVAANTDKLVATCTLTSGALDPEVAETLRSSHVPFLQGARESLTALAALIQYATERPALLAPPRRRAPSMRERALPILQRTRQEISRERVLPYVTTAELLSFYGIPLARGIVVDSPEAAARVSAQWQRPVALKILSPQLPHKTEHGLVALGLSSPAHVAAAAQRLFDQVTEVAGGQSVQVEGLLVQDMVSGGPELIAGVARDEQFGPLIILGWGGIFVEMQRAFTLRLPPLRVADARQMLADLPYQQLLRGFRGLSPVDTEALSALLLALSDMVDDLGDEIDHLDLNPVISLGLGSGVVAVDALAVAGDRACAGL